MVFREKRAINPEQEALLHSKDPYYKVRQRYVTCNWRSIILCLLAGLVPILVWALVNTAPTPETVNNDGLLQSRSSQYNFSPKTSRQPKVSKRPLLKSIQNSPNWKKISKKTYRKQYIPDNDAPPPTEFGTYPQPTFVEVGNKTVATYTFIVTKAVLAPDGFPQPVYLINGQSPGPEIRVKQYSILVVEVTNHLDAPITFHFHGIHQRKSFLSDGVPHVTQDAILPGESFTYRMNLWPQVGTFFYHAHTKMDIVWLFGPLVIEDAADEYEKFPEEYQYDEDKVFILNGVYHENLDDLVTRITGPINNYPPHISSITINGRSFGEWSNNISGEALSTPSKTGYDITTVKKGLRYRFRFINAASDSLLSCNISSHTLTVIEMDGIFTEPVTTDRIALSPGQRYSFLIEMDQEDDNYFIACRHMESTGPLNGLAILHYFNATKPTKKMREFYLNGSTALTMDRWVIDKLVPNLDVNQTDVYQVPVEVDKEFFIDVFEATWGNRQVYLINGHLYEEPEVPYFKQLQAGVNITNIPQVYEINEGDVVQIVFQNTRQGTFCFSHPWHIHGHSFHVVGEGPNEYNSAVDGERIQREVESGKQFQFRDSVTVYANQTVGEVKNGAYCGWVAVRFAAHNNGLWFVHCHVTPHLVLGKKFLIWEHSDEDPMLINLMNAKFDYGQGGGW